MGHTEDSVRCAKCLKVVFRWQVETNIRGWAICPFYRSRICKLCGCTNDRACKDGCSWQDARPEVCSNHTSEEVAALSGK